MKAQVSLCTQLVESLASSWRQAVMIRLSFDYPAASLTSMHSFCLTPPPTYCMHTDHPLHLTSPPMHTDHSLHALNSPTPLLSPPLHALR
jgi:hypothetical protein